MSITIETGIYFTEILNLINNGCGNQLKHDETIIHAEKAMTSNGTALVLLTNYSTIIYFPAISSICEFHMGRRHSIYGFNLEQIEEETPDKDIFTFFGKYSHVFGIYALLDTQLNDKQITEFKRRCTDFPTMVSEIKNIYKNGTEQLQTSLQEMTKILIERINKLEQKLKMYEK